ncbi:hypothetical protein KDW_21020 [Dictyobacter vulcani]|uniref:DUF2382 domain-containing protein n=1 Tax=Dictyobacter vulcani TaxID=2607529 RepID=A0A5J4KNE6_9CHLR|nr:DUF2382 domain-containing protein [Dictyobacter vulcani]GER87940.1 hypothetical protein KDW_21020 [Dictyobacter vulcani]
MTTNYNQLAIGVFDRDVDAKHALDELLQLGLDKDQLGFACRDSNAATSSLRRDLMNLGVSADAATYYDNQYNAGHPIVSVDARQRETEVIAILRRYGAMEERGGTATAANQARADNAGAVSNQPAPPPAYNAPTENPPAYGSAASNQPAYGAPISNQPENAPTYKAPEPTKADNAPAFGSATGAAASTYGTRDQKEVYPAQPSVSKEQPPQEAYPAQPSVSKEQIAKAPQDENTSMNVPVGEEKVDVIRETRMSEEVDISGRPIQGSQRIQEDVRREEIRPDNAAEASKNVRPDSKPGLKNPLDRVKDFIDEKLPIDDKRASSGPDNTLNP